MIHFGAYLVAIQDLNDEQGGLQCKRGELVLIFSRHRNNVQLRPVDLLLEDGRTLNGIPQESVRKHFRLVYSDPDFVICGCSANHGWEIARARLQENKAGDARQ